MKSLSSALAQPVMRRPWLWPRPYRHAMLWGAGALGVALLSPWCLHSWQAWDDACEAEVKWLAQQESTQQLRALTTQLRQTASQPQASFAEPSVLSELAQKLGLQFSHVGMDKPQHNPAMAALHMYQLPVHLNVLGSWDGWLDWLSQWPVSAPGVTVSSLELKADPRGGISAHVMALVPQSTALASAFELPRVNLDEAAANDPFNAHAWMHAQRAHAEQHPSYARLVAPELLRPRDLLEAFPRDRLEYVGQIASWGEVQALVRVLPPTDAKKDASMMSVHRVRVGQHLGQDFGKVLAIETHQLMVRELALSPSGEWHTREVRLSLHEEAP